MCARPATGNDGYRTRCGLFGAGSGTENRGPAGDADEAPKVTRVDQRPYWPWVCTFNESIFTPLAGLVR
jgi:hypothetical protein